MACSGVYISRALGRSTYCFHHVLRCITYVVEVRLMKQKYQYMLSLVHDKIPLRACGQSEPCRYTSNTVFPRLSKHPDGAVVNRSHVKVHEALSSLG